MLLHVLEFHCFLRLNNITLYMSEWVKSFSRVQLFATPWTVAYQASPSMGFSRQEYWSGLPFPSPGDLPNPGIEPGSPALQTDSLSPEPPGNIYIYIHTHTHTYICIYIYIYIFSELKGTGMGKLNLDDHYIYYCGQESLRRSGVVNKRVRNAVLGCNLKNDRMTQNGCLRRPYK